MPNVGWAEMMIVMVVVLIVFGPNRLPEMARSIGKFVRNFQRETSNALAELKEGIEPVKVGVFDEPDAPSKILPETHGPVAAMPPAVAPPAKSPPTSRRTTATKRAVSAPPRTGSRAKSTARKRVPTKAKTAARRTSRRAK